MEDVLVAELNKDLEQVFVDQQTNKAFRSPHFRQFSRIQNCKGKIHNLLTKVFTNMTFYGCFWFFQLISAREAKIDY